MINRVSLEDCSHKPVRDIQPDINKLDGEVARSRKGYINMGNQIRDIRPDINKLDGVVARSRKGYINMGTFRSQKDKQSVYI